MKGRMKLAWETSTIIGALLLCIDAAQGQVNMEQDTDRRGLDYRNFTTAGQPEECRQACAGEPNCKAYTWLPLADNRGLCWLKKGVPQPAAHVTWVSGVKGSGTWNTLKSGEKLVPGDYLISNNGRWKLEFRAGDGNMVFYNTVKGDPDGRVFAANTGHYFDGKLPSPPYPLLHSAVDDNRLQGLLVEHYCQMRSDGALVMVQRVGGPPDPGDGLWQSPTTGHPGAFLRVEDDGNVIIYDHNAKDYVIWHRGLWPW